MKSGIYKITNVITQIVYIGKSKNVVQRKNAHFSALKLNKHNNQHLQNSYNKHGKDNFTFEVLEYCNIEDLAFKELHYLSLYKNNYNIIQTIDNRQNFPQIMKDKMKLSKISKGLTKSIYSKNLTTGEIIKWDSVKESSLKLNVDRRGVQSILKKESYSLHGFTFSYDDNFTRKLKKDYFSLINIVTNEEVQFHSIREISKYLKTDNSYLSKLCKENKIYKNQFIIRRVPS